MNIPLIPIMPFIFFMIGTIIYSNLFLASSKSKIAKYRKKQSKETYTNSFRVKFKEETNKRVSFSKRDKIETLCMNAGLNWSYSDYLITCITISIILFIFFTVFIHNIFLGITFAIFGFSAPGQALEIKKRKRLEKIEKQIGPFLNMVVKRYEYTGDFEKAMTNTVKEFYGTEPLFTELSKTVSEMAVGISIPEALDNLAKRTSNKYLGLLADYYRIAYTLGTDEVRKKLLSQSYVQYEEHRKMKAFLKEQISEPVRDSYLMVASVPVFFIFACFTMTDYLDFMLNDPVGQFGLAGCTVALLGIIWFINKVVGAPLEKLDKKKK